MVKKSNILMTVLVVIAAVGIRAAEPQSSIFKIEFFGPSVHVNSSQSADTCAVVYSNQSSGDLHFRYDSISCDYGILYNEAVDSRIKSLINPTVFDSEAKFYFDRMLSKEELVAPQSGYTSSVPAGKTAYFIKTSPNTYGLIINYYNYIGAIDRSSYYLVKSNAGENRLFKEETLEYQSNVTFVAQVFSGRVDPVFTLKNQANIKKLIDALYNTTDYIRNPSLVIQNPDAWPPLATFMVYDIFNNCSGNNIEVKVARGMVAITRGSKTVYLRDDGSKLYTTIVEVGRDENLVSVDQFGSVYFRDLFPLVIQDRDSISGTITVDINRDVAIKDIAGIRTAVGCKLFVATAESGLYQGNVECYSGGIGPKNPFVFDSMETRIVSSVIKFDNAIYAGTRDGVYKSIDGSSWILDNNGVPAADPVTSLSCDDTTIYAVAGEKTRSLYCKDIDNATWQNALEKHGVSLNTAADKLPENLPFEVRKFYLINCHLVAARDSIYTPVQNTHEPENWSITSVVQAGPAIIVAVNNSCHECSSPHNVYGAVLQSFDFGKTFKVVMKCNLVSDISLLSYGKKVLLKLELIPSSIKFDQAPGLYISEDYGTSWLQFEAGMHVYNTGVMKMVDNYLCVAMDSGSIYMIDLSGINGGAGPTKVQANKLQGSFRSVPVFIGNRAVAVQVPLDAKVVSLSICNLQGKLLQKISLQSNNRCAFNSTEFGRGMYILRVKAGEYLKTQPILFK